MSTLYNVGLADGSIRQGELIGPVWEHVAVYPPSEIRAGTAVGVRSIVHSLAIVLSPDCDLLWDYEVRFDSDSDPGDAHADAEDHPSAVTHVLLCELFGYDDIRPRFKNAGELWRRVRRTRMSGTSI